MLVERLKVLLDYLLSLSFKNFFKIILKFSSSLQQVVKCQTVSRKPMLL
jgi:hypothetical protein